MDGRAVIRSRVGGILLLVAHLLTVAWLTLRPLDVMWVTASNFTPLAGIRADLALGAFEATRRIGEGLLLLAPLGVLLPLAGGRLHVSAWASMARTVAAGALISLTIELLQTGVPGQVVDVDALLLNTAGVALAHVAVVPVVRSRIRGRQTHSGRATARQRPPGRRRTAGQGQEDVPQGATPTIPRVGVAP
jgi:glycopeptide antibiotics resistance protein